MSERMSTSLAAMMKSVLVKLRQQNPQFAEIPVHVDCPEELLPPDAPICTPVLAAVLVYLHAHIGDEQGGVEIVAAEDCGQLILRAEAPLGNADGAAPTELLNQPTSTLVSNEWQTLRETIESIGGGLSCWLTDNRLVLKIACPKSGNAP